MTANITKKIAKLAIAFTAIFSAFPVHAQWRVAESPRFIVYAETEESELLRFTTQLEQFDALLRRFTGTDAEPAEMKVRIFLVENAEIVGRYVGMSNIGGFYTGTVNGPIAVIPEQDLGSGYDRMDPQTILFHEYVHHFMLQYFPANYPAWYIEGFAEYFATVRFRDDGMAEVGHPPIYRARYFQYGDWIRADRMLSNEVENSGMTYAQGWLITHFAATDPEIAGMLSDYLARLQNGESGREAYEESFGAWDRSFDRVLQGYLRRNRFVARVVETEPIAPDAITIRTISEEEATIALLVPRSPGEMEYAVHRAIEYYPNNPQAHVELALEHLSDDEHAEAMAAVDHALSLDPNHVAANIAKGDILLSMAEAADDPESPYWEQSREYIIRANNADPNNPSALASYYGSFPDRESRPDVAVSALERAFVLVQQNSQFRLMLAEEYLYQERFADAARIIGPIAQSPHESETTARARMIMDAARAMHQLPQDESE
ncbi:MAG: tetratricopeptide repeat protein [Parasphingopyxis sp.]|uniref:tetratricopeptide repeat protein n=1 Tax=Parasphingopyxis sp. TaxID=1920299 RepID=UPI003FA07B47